MNKRGRRGFGPMSRAWDAVLNNIGAVLAWLVVAAMAAGVAAGGAWGVRWALDRRELRAARAEAAAEAQLVRSGDEIAERLGCEFVRTERPPAAEGSIDLAADVETIDEGTCAAAGRTLGLGVFRDQRSLRSALALGGAACAMAPGPLYSASGRWWLVTVVEGERTTADRDVIASVAERLGGEVVALCPA
jgi:hypothetical protein